jgi:WD40 repeat protein
MPLELSFPDTNSAEASALVSELRRELLRHGVRPSDIETRRNQEHMGFVEALVFGGTAIGALANLHGAFTFAQVVLDFAKRKNVTAKLEAKDGNLSVTTDRIGVAELQAKLEWLAIQEKRAIGVIFLGASEFPYKPGLDKASFLNSKEEIAGVLTKKYLLTKRVAKLDLFDKNDLTHDIVAKIQGFVRSQKSLTDIIIYYCGHGDFLDNRKYYLTLRGTRENQEATTGLLFDSFAHDLESVLNGKRTYIILDCCFAGAASEIWMSQGGSAFVAEQIQQNYAPRGTALFVAASADEPALAPNEQDTTLFSGHLIKALRDGIRNKAPALSLVDLADYIRGRIENEPIRRRVKPEIHVPRKQDGDVSLSPLFRNVAKTHESAIEETPLAPPAPTPPILLTANPVGQNETQGAPGGVPAQTGRSGDGSDSRLTRFVRDVMPSAAILVAFAAVSVLTYLAYERIFPAEPGSLGEPNLAAAKSAGPGEISVLESRARAFLENHFVHLQSDAKAIADYARNAYQQDVVYQDKKTPREQVIKVINQYFSQYSRRSYAILPGVDVKCEQPDKCRLTGQFKYHLERPNDPVSYHGVSAFTLGVILNPNEVRITEDKSRSVSREYAYSCSPTQVVTTLPGNLGGPMVPTEIRPIGTLAAPLRVIAVSPDKKSFATATDDDRIRLWNADSFTLNKTFLEAHPGLNKLAFSANGKLLASIGSDDTVRVWDVGGGLVLYRFKEPNAQSVAFSAELDSPYLLVGREDGSIPIRDKLFLRATRKLDENTPVRALTFAPDDSGTFAAAGSQSFIRYSFNEGVMRVAANIGEILQLAYSPNGQKILATGSDGKVKIWNLAAPSEPVIEAALGTQRLHAAWSPDGKQIATAGGGDAIMLWDATTLGQPRRVGAHKETIIGIAFHADGRHLLSGARDSTIKLWDTKSGSQRELLTIVPTTDGGYLAYTPDNCYFGSANVDNLFKVRVEGIEKPISEEQKRYLFMRDGFVLPSSR